MDEITKRQIAILKRRRDEMEFTQTDVAEEAGSTLQQYQNFEYGKRKNNSIRNIKEQRIKLY